MTEPSAHLGEFAVKQKIRPIGNQYRVLSTDGGEHLLAFAQQKKMKLKEEIEFFADEARTELLFRVKSRQVMDVSSTTDVFDADDTQLGTFTRKFAKSLLKTTWELSYDGVTAEGTEASTGKAIARRFGLPLRYDLTFVDLDAATQVMAIHRERSLRDSYTVTVPDQRLPFGLAVAMTVAQDAFDDR